MKLIIFMSITCLAVMVVMVSQALRQELKRKQVMDSARDKASEILRIEDALGHLKQVVYGHKPKLLSMITLTDELKKKKSDLQQERNTLEQSINTCNKEKADVEATKIGIKESFDKLKNEHNQAKDSAQKIIEEQKRQILDREKSLCLFVDTANAEARKLCGLSGITQ